MLGSHELLAVVGVAEIPRFVRMDRQLAPPAACLPGLDVEREAPSQGFMNGAVSLAVSSHFSLRLAAYMRRGEKFDYGGVEKHRHLKNRAHLLLP